MEIELNIVLSNFLKHFKTNAFYSQMNFPACQHGPFILTISMNENFHNIIINGIILLQRSQKRIKFRRYTYYT